mmetsp:Transcript_26746/g.57351  ORF Transcript_26746/g.57351 Transcript_26746/m.57351 type:complete len:304 (+) Transcript_26746:346-1257(+)
MVSEAPRAGNHERTRGFGGPGKAIAFCLRPSRTGNTLPSCFVFWKSSCPPISTIGFVSSTRGLGRRVSSPEQLAFPARSRVHDNECRGHGTGPPRTQPSHAMPSVPARSLPSPRGPATLAGGDGDALGRRSHRKLALDNGIPRRCARLCLFGGAALVFLAAMPPCDRSLVRSFVRSPTHSGSRRRTRPPGGALCREGLLHGIRCKDFAPAVRAQGRPGAEPIDHAVQVEDVVAAFRVADPVSHLDVVDANGTGAGYCCALVLSFYFFLLLLPFWFPRNAVETSGVFFGSGRAHQQRREELSFL